MSSTPSIVFPTLGLSDRAFRYRDHVHTDIRKTFERIRREQARERREAQTAQQQLDLVAMPPLRWPSASEATAMAEGSAP